MKEIHILPNDLYITNYCDGRCTPFQSISRLSVEAAHALARDLSQHRGDAFTSFSRFGQEDFHGYYEKRLRTEAWLYGKFLSLGGKPQTSHPLYFVLGHSDFLKAWYEDGHETRLRLADIQPNHVSFTYGDSMSQLDKPSRLDPFTKDTLMDFIRKDHNMNVHEFLNALNRDNRYIEVQLWSDEYVAHNA